MEKQTDFFVSYNNKDAAWAEWIAWQLEEAGYSVIIQAWDFRPGGNFVLEMQKAATGTDRTLLVLSPHYLAAEFTQPEWAQAFATDPKGENRTLLPVRVMECQPQGLLKPIIYIDLVGMEQAEAQAKLLAGIPTGRVKPKAPPGFPGSREQIQHKKEPPAFPGSTFVDHAQLVTKIRNEIRILLDDFHGQPLRDEIVKDADVQSADQELVPPGFSSAVDALDRLHKATQSCLARLAEQKPNRVKPTWDIAEQVFGWLVLLGLDSDAVNASDCAFNPWQGGIEVAIPLETEAGAEVLVARLGERVARWKIVIDNKRVERVVGRDSFIADELESGIGRTDPLKDIFRRIWVELEKSEPPSDKLPERLRAKLEGGERRKEHHFYITIPQTTRECSAFTDPDLLRTLLKALPSLRIFSIGTAQGTRFMFKEADEYSIEESIGAFLGLWKNSHDLSP